MNQSSLSRRHFLRQSAAFGLAVGAAASLPRLLTAAEAKKIPIGLQLYSVRKDCQKDFPATIEAVGKIGYKGVEFAGYYGRDAKTLRKMLDDAGLKCCGTHTGLDTLLGDNFAKTVEFNKTIGNQYLIVPSLPEKYRNSIEAWKNAAKLFNELSEKAKPHGMRVGYHNHSVEFKPVDGQVPWDVFFSNTNKDVIIQFDTGNAMEGGGDPMVYLPKHPGSVASIHAKSFSKTKPEALFGEDELPWKEIFKVCETVGGIEWYIVEYEHETVPPLVSVEKQLKVLCNWGKC